MASNEPNKNNEVNKNKKQTRTARNKGEHRSPKWQLIIIALLFVILFYLLFRIFGADSGPNTDINSTNSSITTTEIDSSSDTSSEEVDSAEETSDDSSADTDSTDETEETDEDVSLEESESPDDNVQTVYTGNWPPVGTSQEGSHDTTDFAEGSADRVEIKQATSMASGIPENEIIEWWIGNDGHNRVEATISNRNESEIYRIYLEWVDNEGWKPLRMEQLIENDKKN